MAASFATPLQNLHLCSPLFVPNPSAPILTRRFGSSRCLDLDLPDDSLTAGDDCLSVSGGDDDLRIVFAAGGSGGHVYPAIAIADEIRNASPNSDILFLGSENGLEKTAVPSAGYDFASIPTVALARPALSPSNLLFPFDLARPVLSSWRRLREFNPQVVVGTGGYVSAPVCIAAALSGIDLVIQEQNSYPGMANRALAPFAKKIFLAFNNSVQYFPKEKCVASGNPVRASLRRFVSKDVARSYFFPRAGAKSYGERKPEVVLVLGGSNGAHAINVAVLHMYKQMLQRNKNRFIIWQTGEDGFCEMESLIKNQKRLVLTPFLHTIDMAYAAADVVVSRSGAMACTEILTAGKPSILVPSPNVAEDHQTKNAYIMADIAGSKILMEDELDSSTLGCIIDEILGNAQLMVEMSEKAVSMARPDASREIAEHILSIVKLATQKQKISMKS